MKHLFNLLPKLTAVAATALIFSSCNRAEYAMLPKSTPYHATYGSVAKPAPAPAAKPAEQDAVAAEMPQEEKNNVAAQPAPAAAAPAAETAAPAAPRAVATAPSRAVRRAAATAQPTLRKMNLVQRAAVSKVTKKLDKLASKAQFKQRTETAETSRLEGKLRQGLILMLVGLLVSILGAIGGVIGNVFAIIGGVLFIIGVVLVLLYLLDEL